MKTMEEIYKDYVRYGTILYTEDFDSTEFEGSFITIRIIKCYSNRRLFKLLDGKVIYMKDLQ